MRHSISIYGISVLLFLSSLGCTAAAASNTAVPDSIELYLIQLINNARVNPRAAASSIGLDPESILESDPGIRDILENGLPPLDYNGNIQLAARECGRKLLADNLVNKGECRLESSLRARGYIPACSKEITGSIMFLNFISKEEAANLVFRDILKKELNATAVEDLKVLSPNVSEIGLSFRSGNVRAAGGHYMAYLLTADLAANICSKTGFQLHALINQARSFPLETAQALSINPEDIPEDLKESFKNGLLPYNLNEMLVAAAADKVDELARDIYDSQNPSGSSDPLDPVVVKAGPEERLAGFGYEAGFADQFTAFLISGGTVAPGSSYVADLFFKAQLRKELSPDNENPVIFSDILNESGIRFSSSDAGNPFSMQFLLAADFGYAKKTAGSFVCGMVFEDFNRNRLYDINEGLGGIQVRIYGNHKNLLFFTNSAGGFEIPLESGKYIVTAYLPDGAEEILVDIIDNNAAVRFLVELENDRI
ncbi:hypothetical protein BuS5_03697 [Desulfosarcina sp. BuS5]|uniref:hypothetical protein n=1 Tax=Desulfosarcina sp. BuS5 TaxID=933262 RepID=UPI000483361E|nr:hypothetical protein [Desulfosarcina sp. BuS5]WDN90726.1 hypothetical protein BuS5_03697 [Desulfosarcina sp. BuS5]